MQDFQKFLKIQVIPGINPKFNLLSLVSLLEHFLFFLPKNKKKKKKGEINHRTPVNSCPVVSLPRRQSCGLPLANCSEHSQRELGKHVVPRELRK